MFKIIFYTTGKKHTVKIFSIHIYLYKIHKIKTLMHLCKNEFKIIFLFKRGFMFTKIISEQKKNYDY